MSEWPSRVRFFLIDSFVNNILINVEDGIYETYLDEGQVKVKSRKSRRKVSDITTWLEAWNNYDK